MQDIPKVHLKQTVPIEAGLIPSARVVEAIQKKKDKNILLTTWGGIGDQICAEPTLRWALTGGKLPGCRFTLAADYPEMFAHLPFDDVYDTKFEKPIFDDYLHLHCGVSQNNLFNVFVSHMATHCVDYPSVAAFHRSLFNSEKNITLKPKLPRDHVLEAIGFAHNLVLVHHGKHWESKTYPESFWNGVLKSIKDRGLIPVLVGAKDNRHGGGYVDVDRTGCIDLLDKTTIMESVWLAQKIGVMVCSDSSPLHMAASGNAWIGYISTAKHPDYITHWRPNEKGVNEYGYRMQNFSKGGMWDLIDYTVAMEDKAVDKVDPQVLSSWLPDPNIFGQWCEEKLNDFISK